MGDEKKSVTEGEVPETGSLEQETPGLDPGRESAEEAAKVFENAEKSEQA